MSKNKSRFDAALEEIRAVSEYDAEMREQTERERSLEPFYCPQCGKSLAIRAISVPVKEPQWNIGTGGYTYVEGETLTTITCEICGWRLATSPSIEEYRRKKHERQMEALRRLIERVSQNGSKE